MKPDRAAPETPSPLRIPALDGLRGISILLVLAAHLNGTRGFALADPTRGDPANVGNLGVRIFFVISGFLITRLLLDEIDASGRVDLKGFYLRRVFRIFPAFYVYLAVILAASAAGLAAVPLDDALFALSYTINFDASHHWLVGHIWSLSVEEQFYLLWPAILALLGPRRGLVAAAATVLLAPLARVAWYHLLPAQRSLIGEAFPTIADAIAVGCVLAGLRDRLWQRARYRGLLRSPLFALVPLVGVAVNAVPHARAFWFVGATITNVAIAISIDRCVRLHDGKVGRLLRARPLTYIGALSYSIYLWQQPFLNRSSDALVCSFPLNLACLAAAALASYHLVEKPLLRLRRRFVEPSQPALGSAG